MRIEEKPIDPAHNWGGYRITQEATCEGTGIKTDTCISCGEMRTKSYGPLGHNWGGYQITQEATCTMTGVKTDTCLRCGDTRSKSYGPIEHNWGGYIVTQEATCEGTGVKTDTCVSCGETRTMSYGPLGHTWAGYKVTQEATCEGLGVKTDTCISCGEIRTVSYGPLGHNWAGYKVTQEATCTTTGVKTDTCARCGETRTMPYGPIEHNWAGYKVTQEATCNETGVQTDTCISCGETRTKPYGPLNHNWAGYKVTQEATCEGTGVKTDTCARCGETRTKPYDALGHNWGGYKVTQEATCEETGVKTDTCARCGETRTMTYGPLEHSWKHSSKAATCTEKGYDITACVRCGEGEEQYYPELGHALESKYNSASHWTVCTRSGCAFKGTVQTHIMRDDYDYQEIDDGSQIVYQYSLYNKCATCGYKEKIGESAIHKHYGTTIIPATATCDKAGYTAGLKCSVEGCGEIYIQPKEIASLGHLSVKYGAKEPTCIESGWDAYVTCMREGCSHTTYNEIPALGHRYIDGICTRCGLQNQTMHPHSYTKLQSDKTNHWYECACGEVKVGSVEPHSGGTATLLQQAVCVMCNTPYGDFAPYTKNSDGTIDFGSYPQTKVTDSSLIVTLNTMAGVFPTVSNQYDWISYDYYNMGSKATDYMWYQDVTYQDNKYRGVYFDQYRLIYTTGDSTANVQQSNGYTTGMIHWFKWEVLNWTILEEADGRALLLCNSVIDAQEYYHNNEEIRYINGREVFPNNYKESDMRQWLNRTFLNAAFDFDQKAIIRTSSVINNTQSTNPYDNPNYWVNGENKYVCATTNDSIFLLSEEEATNPNYKLHVQQARGRKGTDYAYCQGLRAMGTYQCWWLRSPTHEYDSGVRGIGSDGKADLKFNVHRTDYGVVPALRIALL